MQIRELGFRSKTMVIDFWFAVVEKEAFREEGHLFVVRVEEVPIVSKHTGGASHLQWSFVDCLAEIEVVERDSILSAEEESEIDFEVNVIDILNSGRRVVQQL